jgi:hypothetical protein
MAEEHERPEESSDIEAELRAEVERAKAEFQGIQQRYVELRAHYVSLGEPNPDRVPELQSLLAGRRAALEKYSRAVRAFAAFVFGRT